MGRNIPNSSKGKKSKKNIKAEKPMKKHPEDLKQVNTQPTKENERDGKVLEGKNIQDIIAERDQSDVKDTIAKEKESDLKSMEIKDTGFAKDTEKAAHLTIEEKFGADRGPLEVSTDKGSAPSLIEMLKHKDEKARIAAVESLLKIGDKTLSYAFASSMKDDSFQVRLGALRGLYKFGGDVAVDYLVSALEDKHPDVRRRAVIYLGWLKKKELAHYITGALADSSSLVRKVATYTLGDLKDSSAVPYLIKTLDDKDREVRKGALAALRRITKQSFDAESGSPEEIGQAIIEKWKEWWKNVNKEKL